MIITSADIQTVRDIARNISPDRVEPYIMQVEQTLIVPALGAALVEKLEQYREKGEPIDANSETLEQLLNGGYYTVQNKEGGYVRARLAGLIQAEAYLVYSKMLLNQQINVTAYGLTVKQGEFSKDVDDKAIMRASNEAREVGMKYLEDCVEYCKNMRLIAERRYVYKKPKYTVI